MVTTANDRVARDGATQRRGLFRSPDSLLPTGMASLGMTSSGEWTGRVGETWAAQWRRTDRSLASAGALLVDRALAAVPAPRNVIDVGCGAGATTVLLAEHLPDARILGVDLSPDLADVARERLTPYPNVTVITADATALPRQRRRADLMVSRHGVMFFDDPVAGLAALRRAMQPGGRLLFTCFRDRAENDWAADLDALVPPELRAPLVPGAPGPFAFADAARVTGLLRDAGWQDVSAEAHDLPFVTGHGADPVADALAYHQAIGPFAVALREAGKVQRAAMLDGLTRLLSARQTDGEVRFRAALWLCSAAA